MKKVLILGSTGSIGTQTLDVLRKYPDLFKVVGLSTYQNKQLLDSQMEEFDCKKGCVVSGVDSEVLYSGREGLLDLCEDSAADIVVAAISGIAGLESVVKCINLGMDIALANKESLVSGGELVMPLIKEKGVKLLPVDSEHCAIFQSLAGSSDKEVERLILTASGGPFYGMNRQELADKTKYDALKHPNWDMGAKITIDSATLMNKGLEIIEAHYLFNMPVESIDVYVHRQSIVHSMVEYIDGSVIAQLGLPDMRIPIQYALSYPNRIAAAGGKLKVGDMANLTFTSPDMESFGCLRLAIEALKLGRGKTIVLNAANEIAVENFLQEKIGFLEIEDVVDYALSNIDVQSYTTLDGILAADKRTRNLTQEYIDKKFI